MNVKVDCLQVGRQREKEICQEIPREECRMVAREVCGEESENSEASGTTSSRELRVQTTKTTVKQFTETPETVTETKIEAVTESELEDKTDIAAPVMNVHLATESDTETTTPMGFEIAETKEMTNTNPADTTTTPQQEKYVTYYPVVEDISLSTVSPVELATDDLQTITTDSTPIPVMELSTTKLTDLRVPKVIETKSEENVIHIVDVKMLKDVKIDKSPSTVSTTTTTTTTEVTSTSREPATTTRTRLVCLLTHCVTKVVEETTSTGLLKEKMTTTSSTTTTKTTNTTTRTAATTKSTTQSQRTKPTSSSTISREEIPANFVDFENFVKFVNSEEGSGGPASSETSSRITTTSKPAEWSVYVPTLFPVPRKLQSRPRW